MSALARRRRARGARRPSRALALALALLCGAPGLAQADEGERLAQIEDPVERAEAYAAAAYQAYSARDYTTAVALYLEAFRAAPSADILFNLARIYDVGLGDRAQAIRHYRQYVEHPDAGAQRIDLAFERLARLESIETDAGEAQAGEKSASPEPSGPGGAGVEAAAAAPATPGFWTPLRVSAVVVGTAGLVGLGVGAGFGVAALSDAKTARQDCDGDVCRTQRGIDATSSAEKSADLATVCLALGGGLVAAGATLMWWEASSGRDEAARSGWTPIATPSQLGMSWSTRW